MEKAKDFNQIFINLLNQIPDKPAKAVQVEFYIVVLPPLDIMLVKGKENRTLAEKFLEAIKVERDLASISSHQGNEESKPSSSETSIKTNKGISKSDSEKKDKDPMDM